jgi:hypothetical protein
MSNQYLRMLSTGILAATALSACSGNNGPAFSVLDDATLAGPYAPIACALDYINGVGAPHGTLNTNAPVLLQGWIFDPNKQPPQAPQDFVVALKGAKTYAVEGRTGGPRPDVAAALANPSALNSGFDLTVGAAVVPPGTYDALLFIKDKDGTAQVCGTSWKIDVAH